jgi:hypothetical protein
MIPAEMLDFSRYRVQIQSALDYAGDTHTVDDVADMIAAGRAFLWPGPASVIVTELVEHPRQKLLHFFLAAGVRRELAAMTPYILAWGRSQGCTRASLVGRKGWQRTFLKDTGWAVSDLVIMERAL